MRFNLRHIVPVALLSLVGCGVETPVSETVPVAAEELGQARSMLQLSSDCPGCLAGTEGASFASGFERRAPPSPSSWCTATPGTSRAPSCPAR
jgi:hypothetical protein